MGEIVLWTIIRTVILIPLLWLAQPYIDMKFWWLVAAMAVYGFIVHPAIVRYRAFEEKNHDIIESTLCSTCKHFDKSAVLCMKYDKHPSKDFLPCEGLDWEPNPDSGINTEKTL